MSWRTMRGVKLLLWLGVLGGFGAEVRAKGRCESQHRVAFERHVAELCVAAATGEARQGSHPDAPKD